MVSRGVRRDDGASHHAARTVPVSCSEEPSPSVLKAAAQQEVDDVGVGTAIVAVGLH